MNASWIAGAAIITLASFVFGLTGFGIGLVAISLLPLVLPPATVVPVITLYTAAFAVVLSVHLRRHIVWSRLVELVAGSILGAPLGIWLLTAAPADLLKRLIGLTLIGIVLLEWRGASPKRLESRVWSIGAGFLAGIMGGAFATPGPPVILYVMAQDWDARAIKANLQAFFLVNQAVILIGQAIVGLITPEVWSLASLYAIPAAIGFAAGIHFFSRIDHRLFRRLIFSLLFVSGSLLLAGV